MFGRGKGLNRGLNKGLGKGRADAGDKVCFCEATIAPVILDGFACGRAECWRTAVVKASQDRFLAELMRRREAGDHED